MLVSGVPYRSTDKPADGFERFGFVHVPQRLLNGGRDGHVFQHHGQCEVALGGNRVVLAESLEAA